MPNEATSSTVTSIVQPDQPQHGAQPPVPTNSDAFQFAIDLSPYVSVPEQKLTVKDDENQEETQATTHTGSLMASWSIFARTINLDNLLCYVRPRPAHDPEDEQIEMRIQQDAEEQQMEEGRRGYRRDYV
ncbi:hypothetical protein BKA70DRAFT_1242876 [Coprinopsis sp. MPI-PUGE-AT-0042]|nr:hypothetical protein BKA70DRAFT_1242876 [Coprinopsis sp. MPI-PUGE-AT-0042]